MADTDKENLRPIAEPVVATKSPLSSATSIGNATKAQPDELSRGLGMLAFPAQDHDEDRDVLDRDGKTLRNKRSVLFYPSATLAAKSNQAPFSRSAAKRESILALGSIGYLQHLYTKQGIANRNKPLTKGAMTLAIGPAGEAMFAASEDSAPVPPSARAACNQSLAKDAAAAEEERENFELPPSPRAGTYTRPKFLDVARPLEADPHALRALLIQDMRRLLDVWSLSEWVASNSTVASIKQLLSEAASDPDRSSASHASMDIVTTIDVTTKAIRSVRSYILALPQRSTISSASPNEPNGRDRYKRQSSFSAVSRPGQIGMPVPTRTSEILRHDSAAEDSAAVHSSGLTALPRPLTRRPSNIHDTEYSEYLSILRKAALETLSALKEMEARNRVETLGSDREHLDADVSISSEQSVVPTLITGDPDESSIGVFVNHIGYLYRQDLKPADLSEERKTLQSYLQTVNSILEAIALSNQDSWKENRRLFTSRADTRGNTPSAEAMYGTATTPCSRSTHAGEGADVAPDTESTPDWTRADLDQAQVMSSFIIDHCEASFGKDLDHSRLDGVYAAKDDLQSLLSCLCDGYLLCRAFNEAVHRSDKPWGYIASREMHDLQAEEAVLLHKEAMRVKEAQEGEAPTFQTRADRRSVSEDPVAAGEIPSEASTASSRPGWTFRRTENLRVWAAALKLRYHIQSTVTKATSKRVVQGPTYGSLGMGKLALHGRRVASESYTSHTSERESKNQRTIDFDPIKVARKEDGWQEMLSNLLCAWIDAVASEQGSSLSLI